LLPACGLKDALSTHGGQNRLFLDENRAGLALMDAIPYSAESLSLLIGPEGGWTDTERSEAREAGWTPVSMGRYILRTETAAISALAVANAALRR
jgi:16S rRNA (uracil1498-N3)-methyltransferase